MSTGTLPSRAGRSQRRIELFWHCGQRWFEAWTTWDDPHGPVKILFVTPPHIGGTVISNLAPMVAAGKAKAVNRATVDPDRDIVLISQRRHVEVASPKLVDLAVAAGNMIPLPCRRHPLSWAPETSANGASTPMPGA